MFSQYNLHFCRVLEEAHRRVSYRRYWVTEFSGLEGKAVTHRHARGQRGDAAIQLEFGNGLSESALGQEAEPFIDTLEQPDCPHAALGKLPKLYPRVISASKRTDIPAFYLKWMIERCRAGWVDVPNPFYRNAPDPLKRLTHVSLRPEHVRAIVWWSKNYRHYLKHHQEFEEYPVQYFHFTINSRREDLRWIEPDVPSEEEAVAQIRSLVQLRGRPDLIAWRYDPICFWTERNEALSSWDFDFFERMCRKLSSIGVRTCFLSLVDRYASYERRIRRFFPGTELRDPRDEEIAEIREKMRGCVQAYGMSLFACTEPNLILPGVCEKGACINGALLGAKTQGATDRKMRGREECGCTLHTDIGDYVEHECGYSCVYCYANPNHRRFEVLSVSK